MLLECAESRKVASAKNSIVRRMVGWATLADRFWKCQQVRHPLIADLFLLVFRHHRDLADAPGLEPAMHRPQTGRPNRIEVFQTGHSSNGLLQPWMDSGRIKLGVRVSSLSLI
jgi:hypothetical protein